MRNVQGNNNGDDKKINGHEDGRKDIMGDEPVDPSVKPPKPIGDDVADNSGDNKSPK